MQDWALVQLAPQTRPDEIGWPCPFPSLPMAPISDMGRYRGT